MAADELLRDAERTPHAAHLVLEEQPQRLDDAQIHLLGQAAHVVVRLDGGRGSVDRAGLNDVGINRTLCQPLHILDLLRLLVEDLHEVASDDFALGLGVGHARQVAEELRPGLDPLDVEPHVLVGCQHLLELVLAQQARVDEDAIEVVADGLVEQHGGHRRIDTARETQHHAVVAQPLAQLAHGRLDEALRGPRLRASADAHDEVAEQLRAVGRVVDLGVELDAPRLLTLDVVGRHADILRRGDNPVVVGHARDGVAVRHPHLRLGRKPLHQGIPGVAHRQHRTAVLAARRRLHLAAEGRGEELCPVADAQQRQPALDGREVGVGSLLVAHRVGAARENHAPHRRVERRNLVEGVNLAVNIQLAHTPRNELRVLRAEVENQDFFLHYSVGLLVSLDVCSAAAPSAVAPEASPPAPSAECSPEGRAPRRR